jgi:hypothetical protein
MIFCHVLAKVQVFFLFVAIRTFVECQQPLMQRDLVAMQRQPSSSSMYLVPQAASKGRIAAQDTFAKLI